MWAQDERQAETARRVSHEAGKHVPVLQTREWHDAEEWQQHFLTEFKDFPEYEI